MTDRPADVLRAAAGVLHGIARDEPRGPWRWAHPDLEPGEPPLSDEPLRTRRRPLDDPLDELVPSGVAPQPAAGARTGLAHPEFTDALATLLDHVADHLDDDGAVADDISRSAVALARIVLRSAAG